jgi:serine/threonine protein kinase
MHDPPRIGKYAIEEELGTGMGTVYLARDEILGRRVVIKVLHNLTDPEAKARFLEEARAPSMLNHPNVVQIYDWGEDNGRPYIVMEWLQGTDLKQAVEAGRLPNLHQKLVVVLQLAKALEHIHAHGIVHRDIKPQNVILDAQGQVKLIDFGISKREDFSRTQSGVALGTPYYMAPEQLRGGRADSRVDIYSFGVLLYELVTGSKPFGGDTVAEIFQHILNDPLDLATPRRAGVPEDLVGLIESCTKKDPAERIPNFGLVAASIERLIEMDNRIVPVGKAPDVRSIAHAKPDRWIFNDLQPRAIISVAVAVIGTMFLFIVGMNVAPRATLFLLAAAVVAVIAATLAGRVRSEAGRVRSEISRDHSDAPTDLPPQQMTAAVKLAAAGHPPRIMVSRPPAAGAAPARSPAKDSALPASIYRQSTGAFVTTPPPAGPDEVTQIRPQLQPDGEMTGTFQIARDSGSAAESGKPSAVPDVALVITNSTNTVFLGKRYKLHQFPITIGRDTADVQIPFDNAISRLHAEIGFVNGGFTIRDLGSSNGTFVNGRHLQQAPEPLLFGAHILLGTNTELTFVPDEIEELPDLKDEIVGKRYRLTERLFTSAKSVTYKAEDTKLPQSVVIKILSPRLMQHPGYSGQFEREVNLACRLRHPNLNRVLDYGETELTNVQGATLYICMEFMAGGSLSRRLAANQAFPLDRIATWLDRLADGIDYIHSQNVIHGGIKPSAVFFDAHDNPYLTDFALATADGDEGYRTIFGAPAFLAPEQWDGRKLLPATDQYSLSVLTYLLVTGARPYEGQEHPDVRKRNFIRGPVPAHEMAAQNQRAPVPQSISNILMRGMANNPEERFPAVRDFAKAFRLALTGPIHPETARPYVFISYHRATGSAWALLFKNELERQYGCDVFVDSEQRDTVGQFPQKLQKNIERCDVFVCLLGENTLASAWVNREIEAALAAAKPMIPVLQESFQIPGNLDQLPVPVRELLLFDGVKLLDRQNLFVNATIKSLGDAIQQLVSH